ncbi:ATP-binding protein [Escherichia sp. E13S3]|uniref:ATP-binding protein n=1 Tax=Escherichia sp. E13S3 TaxID=2484854 RepID=UPI00102A0145|nr:ATP-binding protein [Escherichia sp. E13S3]RZN52408.1 ATP-binding protein [Escherichia sp. E13S3]
MIERAVYCQADLPEYRNNPLIEALPLQLSKSEAMVALSNFPEINEAERDLKDILREQYVDRIGSFRCPQESFYECYKTIIRLLRNGYINRNPLDIKTVHYLHYNNDSISGNTLGDGTYQHRAGTCSMTGISGVGKSTTLEQVLGYFPQVIEHQNYKGFELSGMRQIVWLKVNCPPNAKPRDLSESLLIAIDDALGNEPTKPPSRAGTLLRIIAQKIKSSFIGVLVIDEMQRLTRTNGENHLIDFLHEIVDSLGVPLVFCGNPEFENKMRHRLRFARRAETAGFMRLNPLAYQSSDWQTFVHYLWRYQWTNVVTPLTNELNIRLHKLSKGILAIAQQIYITAQLKVIGSGNEVITPALLNISESVLSSRSDEFIRTEALIINDNDYPLELAETAPNNRPSLSSPFKPTLVLPVYKPTTILGDLSRPQHDEFAAPLNNYLGQTEAIMAQTTEQVLIRALSLNKGRYSALKHYARYCTDPSIES